MSSFHIYFQLQNVNELKQFQRKLLIACCFLYLFFTFMMPIKFFYTFNYVLALRSYLVQTLHWIVLYSSKVKDLEIPLSTM